MGNRPRGADLQIPIRRVRGETDVPLPCYMTAGAAGMDLFAAVAEPLVLEPGEIVLVPTGIAVAIPAGYEGQ
ncbi:MAG: dUTP diphosphatase, partial [Deltaproteobacteria bacterium]|nr:dUTP diphosphatase [Deltaproteobacteria bacterium]